MLILGGWDEEGNYWYLSDYFGYPLENDDWVYAAWTGFDEEIDPPGQDGYPSDDDVVLLNSFIYYGGFDMTVTIWHPTWGRHPTTGDLVYCRIFDGLSGSIGPGNFYGDSQTFEVQYVDLPQEEFYCLFPGDPGYGHTDTPIPSGGIAVELLTFQALAKDSEVLLEWKTASEINNFGFHIERSLDEVTSHRITEKIIPGAGNSETENTYGYMDRSLINGITYYYNLISVDMDGLEEVANESPVAAIPTAHVPKNFTLSQNYPNPFNPVTEITYAIPRDERVILKVCNVLGAEVATLVNAHQEAGVYTVRWEAEDLASGVHFCRLQAGNFHKIIKMVLLK
jgi:hypothetical protein